MPVYTGETWSDVAEHALELRAHGRRCNAKLEAIDAWGALLAIPEEVDHE